MVSLLIKLFVPNANDTQSPQVRAHYGTLAGIIGIVLNLLLFFAKLIAGFITASIAITADAFNNLSDAGSSIVTLVGFRLAEKPGDAEHPFGHGRVEYVSGLIVSFVILFVGLELIKSSFGKILSPEPTVLSAIPFAILIVSVLVKLWMNHFSRTLAKRINSTAMLATAQDSLSDAVATSAVALGMLLAHFTGWQLDGYIGLIVAAFIIYTGITTFRDNLSPLLGKTPDPQFVQKIKSTVLHHPEIIGIHDLIVHDYGPGQCMISLHAEVRADEDIMLIHDVIDRIELELRGTFHCEATIHMDPIDVDNKAVQHMYERVYGVIRTIDPQMNIHDFRMVVSPSHTNLIFDVVVPHGFRLNDTQVSQAVQSEVQKMDDGVYFAVIRVEHGYL